MTNAERAELKMWIRRLESAVKCVNDLLPNHTMVKIASGKIQSAVNDLEAIK